MPVPLVGTKAVAPRRAGVIEFQLMCRRCLRIRVKVMRMIVRDIRAMDGRHAPGRRWARRHEVTRAPADKMGMRDRRAGMSVNRSRNSAHAADGSYGRK
jgi:hypothetical protein